MARAIKPAASAVRWTRHVAAFCGLGAAGCIDATAPRAMGTIRPELDVSSSSAWTIHVLSIPFCTAGSVALAMSDDGRVVGYCGRAAFEWFGGVASPVAPPGSTLTYATAVAAGGRVAGYARIGGRGTGWARRPDGSFAFIRDAAGDIVDEAFPTDITPAGVVVGRRTVAPSGQTRAFRWSETIGYQHLPSGSLSWSRAEAINDLGGIVVGEASVSGAIGARAVRWTLAGGFSSLPPIGAQATAVDINTAGTMVGTDQGPDGPRPITWTPTGVPSLVSWPGHGTASAMSQLGRITGHVNVEIGGVRAATRPATSRSGVAEVLPMPFWAIHGNATGADRCGSVAGFVANDDLRDGRYAPTLERAVLWRRAGCDR